MTQSAKVLSSMGETLVAVRPIVSNVPVEEVRGVRSGGPVPCGSVLSMVSRRSLTNTRSISTSLPSAKIAVITEIPGAEEERRVVRKLVPPMAYSRGRVTSASTSSAERPGASVCTTTWGGANSGKMSKGERRTATSPTRRRRAAKLSTIRRLRREKAIILPTIFTRPLQQESDRVLCQRGLTRQPLRCPRLLSPLPRRLHDRPASPRWLPLLRQKGWGSGAHTRPLFLRCPRSALPQAPSLLVASAQREPLR